MCNFNLKRLLNVDRSTVRRIQNLNVFINIEEKKRKNRGMIESYMVLQQDTALEAYLHDLLPRLKYAFKRVHYLRIIRC